MRSRPATMSAWCATLAPEIAARTPGRAQGARACRRCARSSGSARARARLPPLRRGAARRAARASAARLAELGADAAIRRSDQHPVHQRHHRPPKGATLTHHNILNNGYLRRRGDAACTPRDRLCIPVPLYHCFGMVMGNLACITHGAAMVYPVRGLRSAGRRSKRSRRSAAPRSTACRPCSSPSSNHPEFARFDLSSLRTGIMAGSPCPIEVMRRVRRRDAHARRHHRLWHDRDEPGELPDRGRRSARAARLDRRPRPCRMSR